MIQDQLHKKIVEKCSDVMEWFVSQASGLQFPFYSSFDIRDSGLKIAPVDANLFPAGFNNICSQDKEAAVEVVRAYLESQYPEGFGKIGLLAEEHTSNAFYWENVLSIKKVLEEVGCEVSILIPRMLEVPLHIKSASGQDVVVHGGSLLDDNGYDLFISNNDFSEAYSSWTESLKVPINPPHQMGWHRRRKHNFFLEYNTLALEFGKVVDVNPYLLQVRSERFAEFDVASDSSRDDLAETVQVFLDKLAAEYRENGLEQKPFAFVKNNAGTYGLAVVKVSSGEEIRSWNYKSRKKMKASKGGFGVTELLIQEGVPTRFVGDQVTAEPCIYVVGPHLVGGFLRTHSKKSESESLNSPGAVYKRLCMSDMEIDLQGCPMEAAYGWISKLGVLSVAREIKASGVTI